MATFAMKTDNSSGGSLFTNEKLKANNRNMEAEPEKPMQILDG